MYKNGVAQNEGTGRHWTKQAKKHVRLLVDLIIRIFSFTSRVIAKRDIKNSFVLFVH